MTGTIWTPDMDRRLQDMIQRDGMSYAQVTAAMGFEPHQKARIARRAVQLRIPPAHDIGGSRPGERKAWNKGMVFAKPRSHRPANPNQPPAIRSGGVMFAKLKPLPAHKVQTYDPNLPLVSMMDLTPKHCRYIPGQPQGEKTMYCSHTHMEGSVYCEKHSGVCYNPLSIREQRVPR